MNNPIFLKIKKEIDEKLLKEDPKKVHTYRFRDELSKELKQAIINEYKPHWKSVFIAGNILNLVTHPLEMQGPVLTSYDITTMINGNRRGYEPPRAGYAGERRSYRSPKS